MTDPLLRSFWLSPDTSVLSKEGGDGLFCSCDRMCASSLRDSLRALLNPGLIEGLDPSTDFSLSVSPDMRKEGRTAWEMLRARSLVNVPKADVGERGELGETPEEPPLIMNGPAEPVSTRSVGVPAIRTES